MVPQLVCEKFKKYKFSFCMLIESRNLSHIHGITTCVLNFSQKSLTNAESDTGQDITSNYQITTPHAGH